MTYKLHNKIDFSDILAAHIHDIKNLLFQLLGNLDKAMLQCNNNINDPVFTQLKFNGERINDKLVQILTLYKIGNDHYQPNFEYHSLSEFIEDCLIETQPLARAKNIDIQAAKVTNMDWVFDRELMLGVIASSIHNALTYAKNKINLSAYQDADGFIVFSVNDDGKGYAKKFLQCYTKAQPTINFKAGHTGLGIYFCSVAAAIHRNNDRSGSVMLSNGGTLGGANFEVRLP